MTIPDNTPRACASCGALLSGTYCNRCGEQILDPGKLTLRYFLGHTVVGELLSLDGKIWRSLALLLFRPGRLALEYAAGRRRPFVNPFRILLTAVILYALATMSGLNITLSINSFTLSSAPATTPADSTIENTLRRIDRLGVVEELLQEKLGSPVADISDAMRLRFNQLLNNFSTALSLAVVALFTLVLYLFFRRRRPLFVEHLAFSMQYYSFVLLSSLPWIAAFKLRLMPGVVFVAVLISTYLWQFTYLTMAIRRFYLAVDERKWRLWLASVGIALLLYFLNAMFITGVQVLSGLVAIQLL